MKKKQQKQKTPTEPESAVKENVDAPATEEPRPHAAGAAPAPEAAEPEQESLQHRLLRLQADFDNFRKRTQRERADLYQRANEDLMAELLPIIDHLELGIATAQQHGAEQAVTDGFQLVHDQCLATLRRFGLEPIDAEGRPFDPHRHEAATYLPSEEHPAETVMAQTRRGYLLGERLLRPAQVVVSSGPAEDPSDAEEEKGV